MRSCYPSPSEDDSFTNFANNEDNPTWTLLGWPWRGHATSVRERGPWSDVMPAPVAITRGSPLRQTRHDQLRRRNAFTKNKRYPCEREGRVNSH